MSANKKVSGGSVVAVFSVILMVVSFLLYTFNVSGVGYFHNAAVKAAPLTWLAAAMVAVAVVLSCLKTQGAAKKIIALISGVLQIAAPAVIAFVLISVIGARMEGLGFIYFSNADVAKEVQTAENMASASGAIASMVAYGVTMIVSVFAAFFTLQKD